MLAIDIIADELRGHEGFSPVPYQDSVGVWTCGFGWNMEARPISRDAAEYIMREHILEAVADAERFEWFAQLCPVRQRVIVNMLYNLGAAGFRTFKKTIGYIEIGAYDWAADEMLDSLWAKQVGRRATELSKLMALG